MIAVLNSQERQKKSNFYNNFYHYHDNITQYGLEGFGNNFHLEIYNQTNVELPHRLFPVFMREAMWERNGVDVHQLSNIAKLMQKANQINTKERCKQTGTSLTKL